MLNPALGIEQVGGNQTLYASLLKLFLEQLAQDFASLPSLLSQLTPTDHEQWKQAHVKRLFTKTSPHGVKLEKCYNSQP
jgi:hypothetical protein